MNRFFVSEKGRFVYVSTSRPPLSALVGEKNGYETYAQAVATRDERQRQIEAHASKRVENWFKKYDYATQRGDLRALNNLCGVK